MTEESTTPDLDEISRKNIEALSRGDLDAGLGALRPDAVWDDSAVEGGIYEGLAAIREHIEEWMGSFEDLELVREEFCDLGNGVALTVNLQKGRPLGTIGWVQIRYAGVSIWADGLMERFTTFTDIDQARAAAERLAQERGEPVSRKNVEVVRGAYAALNEQDFDSLMKLNDADAVFDFSRSIGPQKGVYRGPEEYRRFASDFLDAFELYEATPVEVDVGPHGHIVVRHHVRAKGRGSGLDWENEPDATFVFEVRDGKIFSTTLYQHHTEALKAVGIE